MVYLDEERAGKRRGGRRKGRGKGMGGLEERGEEKRGPPLSNIFHGH